jgi:hypothetical protein
MGKSYLVNLSYNSNDKQLQSETYRLVRECTQPERVSFGWPMWTDRALLQNDSVTLKTAWAQEGHALPITENDLMRAVDSANATVKLASGVNVADIVVANIPKHHGIAGLGLVARPYYTTEDSNELFHRHVGVKWVVRPEFVNGRPRCIRISPEFRDQLYKAGYQDRSTINNMPEAALRLFLEMFR